MITVKQLESGYWYIRGSGPCEWAQPKHWPCSEDSLRAAAFPQASEAFIREAMVLQIPPPTPEDR